VIPLDRVREIAARDHGAHCRHCAGACALARDVLSLADALATAEASIAQLRADLERADHERQRVECERDAMEDDRDAARSALDGLVAAVAGERERAVAVCRAVADGWERASVTAKVDTGLALIRAEGATECADALAAPTGGGE